MDIRSLAYLGFESPNFAEWRTFGPEIFGFGLSDDSDNDTVMLRMDSRHHRIAVRNGERDDLAYIGWEVPSRDALDQAEVELRAAGYDVEVADEALVNERRVLGMVAVTDPVGYRHEIAWGQWYQPNTFAPGRAHAGFVAEEEGLGHFVLVAPMGDQYKSFLTDVLGFQVYAQFPFSFGEDPKSDIVFVRCNSRTHCMAVVPLPGLQGLHHFAIEANKLADVGIAYDLVDQRGVPVTMTLGSHTIDPVTSFYCRTPSGFDIEFVHGGVEVDDGTIIGKPFSTEIWGHRDTGVGLQTSIRPIAVGASVG